MKSNLFIIFVAAYLLTSNAEAISERSYKEPGDLLYSLDDGNKLIKMAEKKFGKLTEADKILFAAVADGHQANYSEGADKDKPEDANSWPEKRTINANRIEWLCRDKQAKELVADKGIWVTGAKIEGTVDLSFAEVPFPLAFWESAFTEKIDIEHSKIKFLAMDGSRTGSILADGMKVDDSVFLREGFRAEGEAAFRKVEIGGDFDCHNGEFINKGKEAISADGISVKGSILLNNGFKANGEVRFPGATIGGDFDCNNGEFNNVDGRAIFADGMDIKGSVFLKNGFKANGEVHFLGAAIGGNFECINGKFINKGGRAILADGMNVKGAVFLRDGFKSNGEVRFPGAAIGGNFDCSDGNFINENGYAISADGIAVKGSVFLNNGFKVEGKVSLVGATFGGHFTWREVNLTGKTILDLRNAKTGVLWDDEKSWPAKGNLFLDGFVYENIGDNAPKDAKSRIEWLNRQGDERFRPGPYEQLAKVLEKMGHNEDAIKIRIEKEEKITKHGGFGWLGKFRRDVFWFFLGYGYQLWRSWLCVGVFIVFGSFVFWKGRKADIIVPMEKDAYVPGKGRQLRERYPKFGILDALIYSFEMFVPVLDLRLAKYWIPDANKRWGPVLRWYMWLHIIAGWTLTTFLIVGLTGLIKK